MADIGQKNLDIWNNRNMTLPIGHMLGNETLVRDYNKPFKGLTPAVTGTLVVHLVDDAEDKYLSFPVEAGVTVYFGLFDRVITAGTTAGLLVAGSKFYY